MCACARARAWLTSAQVVGGFDVEAAVGQPRGAARDPLVETGREPVVVELSHNSEASHPGRQEVLLHGVGHSRGQAGAA